MPFPAAPRLYGSSIAVNLDVREGATHAFLMIRLRRDIIGLLRGIPPWPVLEAPGAVAIAWMAPDTLHVRPADNGQRVRVLPYDTWLFQRVAPVEMPREHRPPAPFANVSLIPNGTLVLVLPDEFLVPSCAPITEPMRFEDDPRADRDRVGRAPTW